MLIRLSQYHACSWMVTIHRLLNRLQVWMLTIHRLLNVYKVWMFTTHRLLNGYKAWMFTIHGLLNVYIVLNAYNPQTAGWLQRSECFTIHRLRTLLTLLPCLDSALHCTLHLLFLYFCIFAFSYSIFIFIHLLLFCVFLFYFFIVFFRANNVCTNWGTTLNFVYCENGIWQ